MIYVISFLLLLGAAIFGTHLIGSSLLDSATESIKNIITRLLDQPWKGLLLGLIATLIIQNSTIIVILTVGLVAARLFTFTQSIGVILGINIGSSITIDLITINPGYFTIPIILLGAILCLRKNINVVKTGYSLMGFTLVIGSLCIMDVLATDMKESIFYYDLFNKIDHSSFIAVLTGIIHTTLGQSNSTINEIATLFATENFYTGIPLIIGANIGTGVMAMIASLVTMKEARLTAYAYLWLNILGAIFIYPFLDYLVELKNILTPAQVNIMYNITLSLITLPFVKYYSSFIDRIYHWRQKSPM